MDKVVVAALRQAQETVQGRASVPVAAQAEIGKSLDHRMQTLRSTSVLIVETSP